MSARSPRSAAGAAGAGAHVVLTGATGFVGKVVLELLVRRRRELGISSIALLVRARGGGGLAGEAEAQARLRKVLASPIFAAYQASELAMVSAVLGDLEREGAGLDEGARAALVGRTTHLIHCAASVEFDLPVAAAASANIRSSLAALELARQCPRLAAMVAVSTAYVTPWRAGALEEKLAPLPRSAEELFAAASAAGDDLGGALLAETGHANTYTLTKCLAEHLLVARRGAVPLSIVRPSIVAAAWRAPEPGWIDSNAALAGGLLYTGLGLMRAWKADPDVRLDVVPVDVVAEEIVDAAFTSPASGDGPVQLRHATMGLTRALRVDLAVDATVRFFRERPGARRLPGLFLGRADQGFAAADLVRRQLPLSLARAALRLGRRPRELRRLERADRLARQLNASFEYFTHHSFDFRRARARDLAGFEPERYLDVVLRGVYRHLAQKDETQELFAGPAHDDARGSLQWMRDPARDGGAAVRGLGLGLRAALAKATSAVTFDRPSFERALAQVPPGAVIVLAPSHRSYLDFLLGSYLCFQHPELGIPVPHIAAAEEFGKIPLVGKLLRSARAFYLKRGVGRESPELSRELARLTAAGGSLMFFVEGQRSRSRRFLAPKRGLLRGLQATGRTFALLPIAMSYDRVPEEEALERELSGGAKPKMRLGPILGWLGELARGEVALGRMHLACGELQLMTPETEVPELARALVAEQQRHTAVSTFHLRAFVAELAREGVRELDEEWLARAIRARGGRVLDSPLDAATAASLSPEVARSLRNQWAPWFFGDALARLPRSFAVADHVARSAWMAVPPARHDGDARTGIVVEALLRPVEEAYAAAARSLELHGELEEAGARGARGALGTPGEGIAVADVAARAAELGRARPGLHLPDVEDALRALTSREARQLVLAERAAAEAAAAPAPGGARGAVASSSGASSSGSSSSSVATGLASSSSSSSATGLPSGTAAGPASPGGAAAWRGR